ncbi:hypothetical protein CDD83_4981 [Cordyceps sp. RAO-2017]|nr:hypothetical protein CDD83_4981 [Cordyceps sp. RAO-2017]
MGVFFDRSASLHRTDEGEGGDTMHQLECVPRRRARSYTLSRTRAVRPAEAEIRCKTAGSGRPHSMCCVLENAREGRKGGVGARAASLNPMIKPGIGWTASPRLSASQPYWAGKRTAQRRASGSQPHRPRPSTLLRAKPPLGCLLRIRHASVGSSAGLGERAFTLDPPKSGSD